MTIDPSASERWLPPGLIWAALGIRRVPWLSSRRAAREQLRKWFRWHWHQWTHGRKR